MTLTAERQLLIVSKAWGRQHGYCFFPTISGEATTKEERIQSYNEGPAFRWPKDRQKILDYWAEHTGDDLYWCPNLFEERRRRIEFAMDEHCLWADLDEVDPASIADYPPTIAWETSPGRYQCLWLIAPGFDIQGASWRGRENHRMTVHTGADPSGWDTTQLLRLPGWPNHKPEYRARNAGKPLPGKLLWDHSRDRRYLPDEFEALPEVQDLGQFDEILEEQINSVNRREVWGRVRLRCSREVRELVGAKEASGDRSNKLWQIERDLADAGCNVSEIVAIARFTVWNKYDGRNDELKRLTVEAAKAIASRPPKVEKKLEAEREGFPDPTPFKAFLDGVRPTKWLVRDIWTEAGCGFIAGAPKSWKSWIAMDLAMSVANGMDFLDHFAVVEPGPVLYIQEEDAPPVLKSRYNKMWPGKRADRVIMEGDRVVWVPPEEDQEPNIAVMVKQGFTASDDTWQSWLDDQLAKGYTTDGDPEHARPYRMVILETLMRISGDVDENRSSDMTQKILAPLDQLSNKHGCAIVIVHHMRKLGTQAKDSERAGGRMLGATANDAWYRDAMFVTRNQNSLEVHRESKEAGTLFFDIEGLQDDNTWSPRVVSIRGYRDRDEPDPGVNKLGKSAGRVTPVLKALRTLPEQAGTKQQIRSAYNRMFRKDITVGGIYQQLLRLEDRDLVSRDPGPTGAVIWTVTDTARQL